VYDIRGGSVKMSQKKFGNSKNDYEIMFNESSMFTKVANDSATPKVRYSFVTIDKLESVEPNNTVDIVAVIEAAQPESSITVKSGANAGKQIAKRDVSLVDQSGKMVSCTLWDANVHTVTEEANQTHPVICIRNVRVSDFGGRSLSTSRQSHLELNPDIDESHILRGWYDMSRGAVNFSSLGGKMGGDGSSRPTEKVTLGEIKDRNLGMEKPAFVRSTGMVTYVKTDKFSYPACPDPEHNNKVTKTTAGWHCEKTNRTYPECDHRYIMTLTVADHTGSQWVTAFNDTGKKLIGTEAKTLVDLQDSGDQSQFQAYFDQMSFRMYNFKMRAKNETYQDEQRVKVSILEAEPVNFAQEAAEMLNGIRNAVQ